jgi:Fe-Mn family superoxide dismutase
MNSVLMHELYFENMSTKGGQPGEATEKEVRARFGSVEKWSEDFLAAAKAARGWAALMHHPINRKLYNVVTDSHDDGPAWLGVPLVVIDCYEHSYYLDYQDRKLAYVQAFATHINWDVVERRLRACQI